MQKFRPEPRRFFRSRNLEALQTELSDHKGSDKTTGRVRSLFTQRHGASILDPTPKQLLRRSVSRSSWQLSQSAARADKVKIKLPSKIVRKIRPLIFMPTPSKAANWSIFLRRLVSHDDQRKQEANESKPGTEKLAPGNNQM